MFFVFIESFFFDSSDIERFEVNIVEIQNILLVLFFKFTLLFWI